jgi:hypothetical protein
MLEESFEWAIVSFGQVGLSKPLRRLALTWWQGGCDIDGFDKNRVRTLGDNKGIWRE